MKTKKIVKREKNKKSNKKVEGNKKNTSAQKKSR